ncbi:MAG: hypothetical protein JWM75_43 [Sphingomonas bacterium]|nr:hypothetical protein [Sphingomonas bacterium]
MAPVLPVPAPNPIAAVAQAPQSIGAVAAVGLARQTRVQSTAEALAQDAQDYTRQHGVTFDEALRRLRAQQESVAETDRIEQTYQDRIAGISIEHHPVYRIVVLLTGAEAVPDQLISAGGMAVPIVFRTGAAATRAELIAAIWRHREAIQAELPRPAGLGADPRTGELVVMLKGMALGREEGDALTARLAALTEVPVRLNPLDGPDANFAAAGGARVEGLNASTGKRNACTTGFVVTDAVRRGVLTAAHCPYSLTYYDPAGTAIPLNFVGAWGARYQDVQIQVSDDALEPLFFADSEKRAARPVTSWRNRASTRAGDVVCHRGEKTGYSCAEVELTDYAPPADLCAGPCDPVWVTVAGPSCRSGDSGGPVFSGTIAFGILKGGSYRADGRCNFYYYMSTDYLPPGWSLLRR